MAYLDKNGLRYFWNKIKEKLNYADYILSNVSEEEVGTWDGDPLYRKVYSIVLPGNRSADTWYNIANVLPNNAELRKYHAYIKNRSGMKSVNYYEDSTNYFLINIRDKFYYKGSNTFSKEELELTIILEYTKTTV